MGTATGILSKETGVTCRSTMYGSSIITRHAIQIEKSRKRIKPSIIKVKRSEYVDFIVAEVIRIVILFARSVYG